MNPDVAVSRKMITIFISSLQKEFAEERQALRDHIENDSLLSRYFEVFLYENLPATDRRVEDVLLDEIERCGIYILLLGNEFGFENADGTSSIEREFNLATELEKTRLVFIKGTDDSIRSPKVRNFIGKVSIDLIRRRFMDTSDLLSHVHASLTRFLDDRGLTNPKSSDSTIQFDARICREASLDDLDAKKIQKFLSLAKRQRKFAIELESSHEAVLERLNLLDHGLITHAAILLFGKNPQKFLPVSEIRCAHFDGPYSGVQSSRLISSLKENKGTLFEITNQAVEFVISRIGRSASDRSKAGRHDIETEIPHLVIIESIANAVVHRDYASNAYIQVNVYSDRVEVRNPGILPPGLSPLQLLQPHASIPRNPLITECFYLASYTEKAGAGIIDMVQSCQDAGLAVPEFKTESNYFVVTIWRNPASSDEQHFAPATPPETEGIADESNTEETSYAKVLPPTRIGAGYQIRREAGDDERCLQVDEYAEVMADLFTRAQGDFCFALFGPWGRGKTFLMNSVAKLLASNHPYEIVHFSAWKYRTTPSLWVHLYETVARCLKSLGWIKRYWLCFRVGLHREGWWPLVGAIMSLIIAVLPFSIKWNAGYWAARLLISTFGVGGTLLLLRVFFHSKRFLTKVQACYGHLPSHSNKLGLQEVIGSDLRLLLRGWLGCTPSKAIKRRSAKEWIKNNLPTFCKACRPTLKRSRSQPKAKRLLLVIDDLDRCDMQEMLTVIESLMLFLHDDEIREHVQIAMIVEEDTLRVALANKYHAIISARRQLNKTHEEAHSGLPLMYDPVVDENIEKLFVSFLRLSPLSGSEVEELADKGTKGVAEEVIEDLNHTGRIERDNGSITVEENEAQKSPVPVAADDAYDQDQHPAEIGEGFVYGAEERRKLIECIRSIGEKCSTIGMSWSPRAIRAFQFKYQLARTLSYKTTGQVPDVDHLLSLLQETILDVRCSKGSDPGSADSAQHNISDGDRLLRKIVAQVV